MKRFWFFLVLACCPALSFARLNMDVSIGFDGSVAPHSWAPVLIEFFNDGPPVQGLVELSPPLPSRAASYAKPVVLPTNSRKRLWLYPYVGNYEHAFDVRFVGSDGKLLSGTSVQFKTLAPGSSLIAFALGSEMNLLPTLRGQPGPDMSFAARMRQGAMPDEATGYSGLTAFLVSDIVGNQWSVGQRKALRNWVALGGHLIVSVHNADNFMASPFWEELLPMQITGSDVVSSLAPLDKAGTPSHLSAETPVAVGTRLRGEIQASAADKPLVISSRFHAGRVTLLTFSVEREPFRSWAGKETFCRDLLLPPPSQPLQNQPQPVQGQVTMQFGAHQSFDDIFRGLLEARLERRISLVWLLALIGCYLVVIGPFDYWLVRHKLKRPVLTWITFPSYVVGFSALIYGIGYTLKSGDSQLIQVSFIDFLPDAGLTHGTTVAGFYSTSNRRYPFAGTIPESHFRLCSSGFDTSPSTTLRSDTEVIETEKGFDCRLAVPIWSSKTFVTEWLAPGTSLEATVTPGPEGPRVRLTNRLATRLSDLTILRRNKVFRLKDLPPNESVTLEIKLQGGTEFTSWLDRLTPASTIQFLQFLGMPFQRPKMENIPSWQDMLPLMSFSQRIRAPEPMRVLNQRDVDLSRQLENGSLIVLAYADQMPPAAVQAKFKPDRTEHHALLRCVLNP